MTDRDPEPRGRERASSRSSAASSRTRSSLRLLVVETCEHRFAKTLSLLSSIPGERYLIDWHDSAEPAVATIVSGEHDLYLIDAALGVDLCTELVLLASTSGGGPVIVLAEPAERELLRHAKAAGAIGYLCKRHMGAAALERAIRAVVRQRSPLPRTVMADDGGARPRPWRSA